MQRLLSYKNPMFINLNIYKGRENISAEDNLMALGI